MKNLRARTLWILTVVVLLISVGLIFACVYTTDWLNKMMIVLMAISFLSFTFLVQLATAKSIKPKVRKKNYVSKVYNNEFSLRNRLGENGFKKRERAYGDSYLLIKDLKAYKVVLVDDPEGYFHNNDYSETTKENKELDKCTVFTGIEIFNKSNNELLAKIADFSLCGGKIYYTALRKIDDKKYMCHNYIEPDTEEKNFALIELLVMLGFKEEIVEE
jgi:hypothetical protein